MEALCLVTHLIFLSLHRIPMLVSERRGFLGLLLSRFLRHLFKLFSRVFLRLRRFKSVTAVNFVVHELFKFLVGCEIVFFISLSFVLFLDQSMDALGLLPRQVSLIDRSCVDSSNSLKSVQIRLGGRVGCQVRQLRKFLVKFESVRVSLVLGSDSHVFFSLVMASQLFPLLRWEERLCEPFSYELLIFLCDVRLSFLKEKQALLPQLLQVLFALVAFNNEVHQRRLFFNVLVVLFVGWELHHFVYVEDIPELFCVHLGLVLVVAKGVLTQGVTHIRERRLVPREEVQVSGHICVHRLIFGVRCGKRTRDLLLCCDRLQLL